MRKERLWIWIMGCRETRDGGDTCKYITARDLKTPQPHNQTRERKKSVQATANCEQVDIYFHPFYRLNKRTILIIILLRDELQR